MSDNPRIQRIATETLSALADLKRQRDSLDAQIAALEEIAHIQEEACRKHGIDLHEHAIPSFNQQGAPSRGPREGSKRHRICEAAAEFLADGQPKHRMDIAKHLRLRRSPPMAVRSRWVRRWTRARSIRCRLA